jgi:broad specificity phosphatase PhoE
MIYLVRHGETEFNRDGRLQGRVDSPLTELGLAQAACVGAWFAARIADRAGWRLLASPLPRTRRTAAIIAEATGLAVEIDARLIELSLGSWEGLAREEIEATRPELTGAKFFLRSPDGESWDSAAERLAPFRAEHGDSPDNVIAVSHAGAGRVLRGLNLGLGVDAARELDTPQDAVFVLTPGAEARFDCE